MENDSITKNKLISYTVLAAGILLIVVSVIIFIINYIGINNQPSPGPTTDSVQLSSGQVVSSASLEEGIQEFFDRGADMYLLWQFSGDIKNPVASDDFSFYRNDPSGNTVCTAYKNLKQANPNKILGVNMWDIGRRDLDIAKDNFRWLAGCKVTVVRIFMGTYLGDDEGDVAGKHLQNAIRAADEINQELSLTGSNKIRLIPAIGDYSNGGGGVPKGGDGSFYNSDHAQQVAFTAEVIQAGGSSDLIYGYEIANEPHCKGYEQGSIPAYYEWVAKFAQQLSVTGKEIGVGQFSHTDLGSCDSPLPESDPKSSGFYLSNNNQNITMTSGHFYHPQEKDRVRLAAKVSVEELNKTFYVGEASIDATVSSIQSVSVDPEIDIEEDIDDVEEEQEQEQEQEQEEDQEEVEEEEDIIDEEQDDDVDEVIDFGSVDDDSETDDNFDSQEVLDTLPETSLESDIALILIASAIFLSGFIFHFRYNKL